MHQQFEDRYLIRTSQSDRCFNVKRVLSVSCDILSDVGESSHWRGSRELELRESIYALHKVIQSLGPPGTALRKFNRLGQRTTHPRNRKAAEAHRSRKPRAIRTELGGCGAHRCTCSRKPDECTGSGCDFLARWLPRHNKRALLRTRDLQEISRGWPYLASEGKALNHTRDDYDYWRCYSHGRVRWRDCDGRSQFPSA